MKLYEMQEQLLTIDNILAENTNEETNEILESAKEQLLSEIGGKIENILDYISDCKGKIEQIKKEEERLYNKRKSFERRIDYLKNLILGQLKLTGLQKAEYGMWTASIAKTPAKLVLDIPEEDIPDLYKKATWTVDKNAIRDSMSGDKFYIPQIDGMPLQAAHLETGETVRIK